MRFVSGSANCNRLVCENIECKQDIKRVFFVFGLYAINMKFIHVRYGAFRDCPANSDDLFFIILIYVDSCRLTAVNEIFDAGIFDLNSRNGFTSLYGLISFTLDNFKSCWPCC